MQNNYFHLQAAQEQLLRLAATNLLHYLELERESPIVDRAKSPCGLLRDLEIILTFVSRFFAGLAVVIGSAKSDPKFVATTVDPIPMPPSLVAAESRFEHRHPLSPGRLLDLKVERCVRYGDRDHDVETLWLSWTEWEVAVALYKAGASGLTAAELARKVTRWRDGCPSNEAVQRIVSKVTVKFDDAGIPLRGRTENVNPSVAAPSKPRRRGRPPRPGDGQFRAFLDEITAEIQRT